MTSKKNVPPENSSPSDYPSSDHTEETTSDAPLRHSRPQKLTPRPASERTPLTELLGKWPGDIDDGFDEWLKEHRRSGKV